MTHYLQAKRLVSGHMLGRDDRVPEGEVVEVPDGVAADRLIRTNHFYDRGEHDEEPEPLTHPEMVDDTTVASDEDATYEDPSSTNPSTVGDRVNEGEPVNYEQPLDIGGENADLNDDMVPDQSNNPVTVVDGIGPATADSLSDKYGVTTVGELAALDPSENEDIAGFIDDARKLVT